MNMGNAPIKVLVVEDNPGFLRLVSDILVGSKKPFFEIQSAATLSQAAACLEQTPNIDAVLLDLTLPDSQGLDTFTRLHTQAPQLPFVILSGVDDESLALDAICQGAQDYLVKGQSEVTTLRRVIHYAIERNRLSKAHGNPPKASSDLPVSQNAVSASLEACGLLGCLKEAVAQKASDLFVSINESPTLKVDGGFKRLPQTAVTQERISEMIDVILSEAQKKLFSQGKEIDLALEAPGLSRFRVNVFKTSLGSALAFRPIPKTIPNIDELGLPPVLRELTKVTRGLILVTGPTGNGKSTTLAAFVDEINRRDEKHIITIEDPIEYVIAHQKSLVHQREVELHTRSFADGLKSALRENPDIIMVGELRDLESIGLAIRAAETGHLVLGTLHSGSTVQAITRILDVFESGLKGQIQTQLAQSLQGIITQKLLKRADGQGRIVATEVLIPTPAIRNLIRSGQLQQIKMYLEIGRKEGMHTLEQNIKELIAQGLVGPEALVETDSPGAL
jgi:twitching motility protein PilT